MLENTFNWLLEQQLLISLLILSLLVLERYSLKWLNANFVYKLWLMLPITLLLANMPEHFKPLPNNVISTMLISPKQGFSTTISISWVLVYSAIFSILALTAIVVHLRFINQLRLTNLDDKVLIDAHPDMQLLQSSAVSTPMVIGLFSNQLVLPTAYTQHIDSTALTLIIEHEKVHIKRADNLFNALALMATLLIWFNPLAWLGYMNFRRLQELSCDEKVLTNKTTQQRILYSKALINCAANSRAGLIAYSHYGDKNTMLQRLNQIKHTGNSSMIAKGALLIFAAGMISSFAIAKQPEAISKVQAISPIMRIEPLYPIQAAEQGISGSVVLKYDISPAGKTQNVSVVNAKPERVFDKEAKKALMQWQYKPSNSGFKDVLVQLDFAIDSNYKSEELIEKVTVAAK
ncbi:TonB family protein [Pseudoalteromonas sp. SG41-1]|uniref:M56 family metallopeptidase n=1 Tax=Pseudoalteromonas TaxID=53246 RepID=UPI001230ACC6|nr:MULTISPECIES: TonB family protein [Pseudoalteromonas]MBB1303084.1 TonB family protein [Pseudoalteromonas sp. SR44-8]MBB1507096.1 TonB family protein [Pseudoalteromonas sp. SG41-1]|tara:strand:- start:19757 stop:20968 length:1212 start_codon:yes stop_codon:yes gene_type:complete